MRKLWDFSSWMYFCIFIFQTLSFESYNPYLSAILGMHGLSFWKTRFIWWLGGGGRFQIQPQELAESQVASFTYGSSTKAELLPLSQGLRLAKSWGYSQLIKPIIHMEFTTHKLLSTK